MARILIVDDEPSLLFVLSKLLETNNHEVTTIRDSYKAKELIEEDAAFDLFIFDVRMSPVDGMQLLKICKERHPDTRVIMVTAYYSDEVREEALRIGAFAYLAKPFSIHEILSAIANAIAGEAASS